MDLHRLTQTSINYLFEYLVDLVYLVSLGEDLVDQVDYIRLSYLFQLSVNYLLSIC